MKRVVLITGASAGIGKATAVLLAERGYKVYGAARRIERMEELKSLGIETLSMDVSDDESMVKGVKYIVEKEGRLDILINNAGFGFYGAIEDVAISSAKYQMEVNVFGVARLIQLVLPYMREHKWGKIVNISSIGGKVASPFGGWYHASKYAIEGLSDSLRNEVKLFGIDVILIEPGLIKSEWGSIARDNLLKTSSEGDYRSMVEKLTRIFGGTDHKHSEATVIAALIYNSIMVKRPKARYSAGYLAKPILFLRWILPDCLIDRVIIGQLK